MLTASHISQILERNGARPVYQVAILDFLNRARVPEDISGPEQGQGPLSDDPHRRRGVGRGYDIGPQVAQYILDRREELGGRFSTMEQLAEIPYFGEDKFNDLVYTYVNRRAPLPTGLGLDFDRMIGALSTLELANLQDKRGHVESLSTVRKLALDDQIRGERRSLLNWNDVIPGAESTQPPLSWALSTAENEAMHIVRKQTTVSGGDNMVDMPVLLAGLDARNNASAVRSKSVELEIGSNVEFATFLQGIANATYQYLSQQDLGRFRLDTEAIDRFYAQTFPLEALVATADVYAMEYDPGYSLSWNLVNYYTNKNGPIKRRFTNLAKQLGLGELQGERFSSDNKDFRQSLTDRIVQSALKILSDNEGSSQAQGMVERRGGSQEYAAYEEVAAYAADKFVGEVQLRLNLELHRPAILSWNRLEARPRTKDLGRALRAEVRDPLWFLSRQWQLGEFEGEDAGSSVEMRVDMETTQVNRYSLRKGAARPYDNSTPIETVVEREMVDFDLTLSQEMGRHWEKVVRRHLLASPPYTSLQIDTILSDFKASTALQFVLPTPTDDYPEIYGDSALLRLYAAIGGGRMLNGGELYKALKAGAGAETFLPSTTTDLTNRLLLAKNDFLAWFEKVYNQPVSVGDDAWVPSQLEYQFQCSAPASPSTRTVLTADEYAQGRMDWYSFDFELDNSKSDPSLRSIAGDSGLIERRTVTVLPGDLRFPGMPLARWWEFEDWKVDLGNIVADTTDIPKLLQTEFALIYSNDWMLLPHDVKVGSICSIKSIVVRDVFGQYTDVKAAGASDTGDWRRWAMFNLNRRSVTSSAAADTRLFVPPALIKTMESEPLEVVTFLRDEMANMVWGIESTIPDGRGGGKDGFEAATKLYDYLVSITPPTAPLAPPVPNNAEIKYELGTTVPENWIPFIPMRKGGVMSREIQLRRAAMPRLIPGRTPERVRPRTDLLKEGYNPVAGTWDPYFIYEEEVPRSGAIVNRTWQRTRWMDGSVLTWLGRRKQNGRGEVNSGLEYDLVKPKTV